MTPSRCRRAAAAASIACCLLLASRARANGAFPYVSQLVGNPADPQQLALRGNFGLVVTRDGGQNWDWLCEAGLGYQNYEPPIALLKSGALLLALPKGVSRGEPGWCSFEAASGVNANVVDVSAEWSKPKAALALSVDLSSASSQVWESLDDGKSFSPLGAAFPDFFATTIDAAATNADVIYVSGVSNFDGHGILFQSGDHGQSFTQHKVPDNFLISSSPYISAVDPKASDTVYVRSDSAPGNLLVTHDGGVHFDQILTLNGPVRGFALSPDGSTIIASGLSAGVFRVDTATLESEKVGCDGVAGLAWTATGLYACGELLGNGYLVASSSDEGRNFQPLLLPTCIRGPLECGAATSIGNACPAAWSAVRATLGPDGCQTDVPTPRTACFDTAGAGGSPDEGSDVSGSGGAASGSGGAASNAGGTAHAGSSIGASQSPTDAGAPGEGATPSKASTLRPSGGSCSLWAPSSPGSRWRVLLLIFAAYAAGRRRKSVSA